MNNLQKALYNIEIETTEAYEKELSTQTKHKFSRRYLKQRREIIGMYENEAAEGDYKHSFEGGLKRPIRMRTILLAALIMLFATASVIAIAKPQIYYVIKEKIRSWDITFSEEDGKPIDDTFEVIKPDIPEGFEITMEEQAEFSYFLTYENEEGKFIDYGQTPADGLSVSIDSERSTNETVNIDGEEAIVSRENDITMLIFNDGKYVYSINSNEDETIIINIMKDILTRQKNY